MQSRSVLLLATNKQKYLNFAYNCAESIKLHNPGLPIFIATNIIPATGYAGVTFVNVSDEIAKLNIIAKIHLDQLVQTEETLFIDSDCLCYGNLNTIFEACQGHHITVVGRVISRLKEWGPESSAEALRLYGTDDYVMFNGGFYYIRKSATTTLIFDKARTMFTNYDNINFNRIQNGWENEELIFAHILTPNGETPIADDGKLMTDLYTDRRPKILNVLTGVRILRNNGYPLTKPREIYPVTFSPIILHFGGNNINSYPYISQSLLLKLNKLGLPVLLSSFITYLLMDAPFKIYHFIKRYWHHYANEQSN